MILKLKNSDNNSFKNEKLGNNKSQEQINKLNNECNNYKNEIQKLNNEIKKISKNLSEEKDKIKEKDSQIISLKMNLGKNINRKEIEDFQEENYKKELILLSNMIKNINSLLNNKQRELTKSKQRKNQNDAFIMDEDEKEEIENILNNNNNNEIKDFKSIPELMSKLNNYNKEINQNIDLLVNLARKSLSNNNNIPKLNNNNNNTDNKNQRINKELENENKFLKGVINECVSTIFESIKESAPNMVEEDENTFGINIRNNNIPINISDNNFNENNFDPDIIQDAVNKFKEYNSQINEQIKQLQEEKNNYEKEAHSNLVKANAYKNALDDAINKINNNMNEENNQKNSKNEERTFTVEDLENPQEDNKDKKSNQDYKKLNTNLLSIHNDLLNKLKLKDEECKKHQEIINNLLSINNGIGENLNIKKKNEDILFEDHSNDKKKNKTYNIIPKQGIDYLGMLNQDIENNQRVNSQENYQNIQELLDDNKNLKENETLLQEQLNVIKEELKETREQVNILVQENTTLKEELQAAKTLKNEEVIGPLRSALERLIMEIKLTQKIKEILTVILKLACYTEDQIFTIYYYREKKKNFLNMFPLE